jgi:Flp pilus assembly protein CpaB
VATSATLELSPASKLEGTVLATTGGPVSLRVKAVADEDRGLSAWPGSTFQVSGAVRRATSASIS